MGTTAKSRPKPRKGSHRYSVTDEVRKLEKGQDMKTEQLQDATIVASHRATLRCKYTVDSRTIRVSRFEHGRDPHAVTVVWSDGWSHYENYIEATKAYTARMTWGGKWVVSMVSDGAVAVCLDAI